jgi:hypothetical protein
MLLWSASDTAIQFYPHVLDGLKASSVISPIPSRNCCWVWWALSSALNNISWWFRFMALNAPSNISAISQQSILLVEETGVPRENHWPVASHWQTLSHNISIEYASPWMGFELTTLVVIGTDCTGSCKSNYHTIKTTTAPNLVEAVAGRNLSSKWHRLINLSSTWYMSFGCHGIRSFSYRTTLMKPTLEVVQCHRSTTKFNSSCDRIFTPMPPCNHT